MSKIHFLLIMFLLTALGCRNQEFQPQWLEEQAPEVYRAKFETTKGDFEIKVERQWSPKAADRLYQLIEHRYFDNGIFYRVVPDFVAQFGNTDPESMDKWRKVKIPDEEVKMGNKRGTLSFARTAKETRDLEIFINLSDNDVLDTIQFEGVRGFPAVGTVIKGMEVVDKLYNGYGENTMSDPNLYSNRKAFYKSHPKLDLIKRAYILD